MLDSYDEFNNWNNIGDKVLHIELRNWSNYMLIAPLSAHTLSKFANGLCDDTLSCVFRAWEFNGNTTKPVLVAPAMNTAMYNHPLTKQQLYAVQNFFTSNDAAAGSTTKEQADDKVGGGDNDNKSSSRDSSTITIIKPQSKLLACGDIGNGALASVDTIIQSVRNVISMR